MDRDNRETNLLYGWTNHFIVEMCDFLYQTFSFLQLCLKPLYLQHRTFLDASAPRLRDAVLCPLDVPIARGARAQDQLGCAARRPLSMPPLRTVSTLGDYPSGRSIYLYCTTYAFGATVCMFISDALRIMCCGVRITHRVSCITRNRWVYVYAHYICFICSAH